MTATTYPQGGQMAGLDADLARTVRQTSNMRQAFYGVVLLVALAGQVSGAVEALGIPLLAAVPAVAALELGGIVVLANADVRRRLGERATASRLLSVAIAAGAVAFNWLAHANHLLGGFFAGMSALGYLVWLMHTENQRRDRLRATGDLPPTTPAYELFGHWLRHPLLTLRAQHLAKADASLGLYDSLDAARAQVRRERREAAIAKVLHRKIRAAVDPTTADIATATYDLGEVAKRLAATADYDGLTALIAADLTADRLAPTTSTIEALTPNVPGGPDERPATATQGPGRLALKAAPATGDATESWSLGTQVIAALEEHTTPDDPRDSLLLTAYVGDLLNLNDTERLTAEGIVRTWRAGRATPAPVPAVTPPATKAAPAKVSKRQPSAAARVASAIARSPRASDATIAARLGLSEATVKRHRRQAVDSVSTTSTPALHAG